MMKKIAVVTTVHPRFDTRVWVKELQALSELKNATVTYHVMDGLGDDLDATTGVQIYDLGQRPSRRLRRMIFGSWRMYRHLKQQKVDIVHFHDPELIWIALLLGAGGHKIVYDVHEDLPNQVRNKPWIPKLLVGMVSACVARVEWVAGKCFEGIVPATEPIAIRFPAHKTHSVKNYPSLEEIQPDTPTPYVDRTRNAVYIGSISRTRGCVDIIDAMALVQHPDCMLQLGGVANQNSLQRDMENSLGWKRVNALGWLSRDRVSDELDQAALGLVVLHPTPSYVVSLPVKMFEYMAAGIPVVASDFPLFKEIVEDSDCGIVVPPHNPQAIADAIDAILADPERAAQMGRNGIRAVQEKYNWSREKKAFQKFYRDYILKDT